MLSYTIVLTDKANNTITVPASDIVQDSLQYNRQYLNGLESSSQFVRVSIVGDSSSAAWILTHKAIEANLTCNDEDDPYHYNFSGLLSEKTSWTIGSNGCRNLQVTIEDKRSLLDLAYDEDKDFYFSGTLDSLVEAIAEKTGLTFGSDYSEMGLTSISSMISRGTTCKEVLTTACYECCTFFTVDGNLINIRSIQDASEDENVLTENDIWDKNGSAISVNKDLQQYYESEVRYTVTKSLSDATIFRDDSFNATSPHSLAAHYYYPGDKPITSTDPGTPSNAGAAYVETGKKLVTFSNPVIHVTASPSLVSTCTKYDDGSINILLKNNNNVSSLLSSLSVTADIVYEDVEERINAGVESNKKFTYEAQWIHNKTAATHLANLIQQYYEYCDYSYSFYTKNTLELGKVYALDESLFSGIDTEVLITKVEYTSKLMDGAPLYKVSAIGWSEFNLDLPGRSESSRIIPPESGQGIPGEEGQPGDPGEDAKVFEIVCPISTFNADKRITGSISVTIYADIQGYSDIIPEWSVEGGSLRSRTGLTNVLTIQRNTATDVVLTLISSEIPRYTEFVIHPIDVTDYNKNWGTLTALPSGVILDGDYFIAGGNFSTYVLGKPYVRSSNRWVDLTANSVENTTRLFNLLSNVMSSDLTVPSTSAMYAWFGTLIAQDAAIQRLFSKNITILDPGSIHSSSYNDDGTPADPDQPDLPGFYLGSDGSFVCNSASANSIAITGNSVFEGKFNTGVLNTLVNPASSTDFYSAANWNQAKVLCQALSNAGYPMGSYLSPANPIRCDIKNVTSSVYYINYYIGGGGYQIHFWDKSLREVDIRNIVTCTKNGGNYVNYLWSIDNNSLGQWAVGGITLVVWTGGNLLEVDIPDKDYAGGNPSGTLFRGPQTTVNNILCYPVYVKA